MSSDPQQMSTSVKAGGAALGAGGLIALIWKYHDQAAALLIILIGVIVVIAAVIAIAKLGVLRTRGAAKTFKEDIGSKLRATPGGVADADGRAKLDDLRRSLQSGIDKLAATGKNLYVLPWYLMVGEPGSGKTKAIAAAGVSLPGFQDPLQGAGGTVNMNWWFTNSGIILDTAGRLMLPEVNTGDNPEWDEFLKTLNRRRPNCPINGLVLAIPADTLITDTAIEIDRKAGDIAFQFNKLQVTLGIRFPVFVLITKCDKILGFREFFESVNQPDEQAQLLGWANPDKLDDAFKPELVEEHLTKVHEQLVRRRARLIQDPVHTDDPNGRRIDQIDALYEFPEALVGLAPRLRRYLEPIFVAGPLSARPLFLRGIFFTSSLQTGEAVDAAMSAIMGVDIAKSHAGGVVSEKPYFLKHVFQEKVFRERGLVTRTTNVSNLKRRRKVAVLSAGILSVLALTGFTWFSRNQLDRDLGDHVQVWEGVQKWGETDQEAIIGSDGRYHGQNKGGAGNKTTLVKLHQDARKEIPTEVHVPVVFRPVARLSADLDGERRKAYAAFFAGKVLQPIVKRARSQMQNSIAEQWSPDATAALRQMILLEAKQPLSAHESFNLDGIVPYALDATHREEDRKLWDADKQIWNDDLHWVYSPAPDGTGAKWPPDFVAERTANAEPIRKGVENFIHYTDAQAEASKAQRDAVRNVAEKLDALDKAERSLLEIRPEIDKVGGEKWEQAKLPVAHWKELRPNVDVAKKDLDEALKKLQAAGWKQQSSSDPGLAAFYQRIVQGTIDQQLKDYEALLSAIPSDSSDNVLQDARSQLTDAQAKANKARDAAKQDTYATTLSNLEKMMLCRLPGDDNQPRLYEAQFEAVVNCDAELPGNPPTQVPTDFAETFDTLSRQLTEANAKIDRTRKVVVKDGREWKLCDLADAMTNTISGPRRKAVLLEVAVRNAAETKDDWVNQLKAVNVAAGGDPIVIPVTGIDSSFPSPEHDPRRLAPVQREWDAVMSRGGFTAAVRPQGIMDWDDLYKIVKEKQKGFAAVREQFARYWTDGWKADWAVRQGVPWTDLQAKLLTMNADSVDNAIHAFADLKAQSQALVMPNGTPATVASAEQPLVEKVRIRLTNWGKLSEDAAKARVYLLGLNQLALAERFLLVPGQDVSSAQPSPSLYEDYWTHLFVAALDSVGRSAEDRSRLAFKSLWEQYQRFPLAPPNPDKEMDELTPKELDTACALIEQVWGPYQAKPQAAAGPAPGQGVSGMDLFRLPMLRLTGDGGLPQDETQLAWARSLRKLQPWLTALRNGTVNCRISILQGADDGTSVSNDYLYGEIEQNKVPLVDTRKNSVYNIRFYEKGVDAQPPEGLVVKPNAPVTLGLQPTTNGPVQKRIDLARGNWAQLRLVVEVGRDNKDRSVSRIDGSGGAGANTYKVTFHNRTKDAPEKTFDYRVTLSDGSGDELPIDFWNSNRR